MDAAAEVQALPILIFYLLMLALTATLSWCRKGRIGISLLSSLSLPLAVFHMAWLLMPRRAAQAAVGPGLPNATASPDAPRPATREQANDHFALWPLLIALGGPAALVLLYATFLGANFLFVMGIGPALIMTWVAAAMMVLVPGITAVVGGAWRTAASCAVPPVVAVLGALQFSAVTHECVRLGDILHFEVMRLPYWLAVQAMPESTGPKLVVFNWGGMIWASIGAVYDESDEILLPPEQQSNAWRARAIESELACGGYHIHRSHGHLYLVDFPC